MVIESDNIQESGFQKLIEAGVLIHKDNDESSLMHNKFLVIDDSIVWSGSGNYSYYSFYRNYENFVRIDNENIANFYTQEFDELKENLSIPDYYKYNNIEVFFSPEDNIKEHLINYIQNAKDSIYFMIYSFTDIDIANALIEAKNRGVEVKGIFDDKWSQNRYSKDEYLKNNNIEIKYDDSKRLLHNKVIIIDNKITITGSYNFTEAANNENRENSLIINDKNIANNYTKEFFRIYNLR